MVIALPPFGKMWENYPTDHKEKIAADIGGRVDRNVQSGVFSDTCGIRVSHSFNYAGHLIPKGHRLRKAHDRIMATVSGADQLWYAFRVQDLVAYISEIFGSPSLVVRSPAHTLGVDLSASFGGRRGVLAFELIGDKKKLERHIDLWNGQIIRYNDEVASKSTVVSLWEAFQS